MTDQVLQLIMFQTWQIAALAIVVVIINRTVAKNSPHLAHAMWMLVLIKCVTPPIWGHSLGVFSQAQAFWVADPITQQPIPHDQPVVVPANEPRSEMAVVPPAEVSFPDETDEVSESDAAWTLAVPAAEPLRVFERGVFIEPQAWKPSWALILLSLIAIGALMTISIMIVRCVLCLRHIYQHRTTEFDESLNEQLQQLSKKLRIRRVPRIIVSDVFFGPAVLGLWKHVIVLPRCLVKAESPVEEQSKGASEPGSKGDMSELRSHSPEHARSSAPALSTLDPILAHELLHIRRGDLRAGAMQAIVQSFWWFHPAVWLCNRWLSREAERCCDEQVIAELECSPAQYARSLLSVIESKHALQPIPIFPGMKPVEITSQRMERIMSLKSNLKKQTPLWCWLAVAVLAIVVLPGAGAKSDETIVATHQEETSEPKPANATDAAVAQISTRVYVVGDLMERLAKEQGLSSEQAKQSLVEIFEGSISPVQRVTTNPVIAEQPAKPKDKSEKKRLLEKTAQINQLSSYTIEDDRLVAIQSDAGHAELQKLIEAFRKFGFTKFQITARYILGSADEINLLMESLDLEKPFVASTKSESALDPSKSSDESGKQSSTLHIGMGGLVSAEQAGKIEELARSRADRLSIQSPKVIAFNGQAATIQVGETKPFIVGFEKNGEPTIRTVDEGLTLRVTPSVVDTGLIRLKAVASVSAASKQSEVQVSVPGKVTETPRTIQMPGISTKQVQTTVELRNEQVLYLTGLTVAKDEKEQAVLVILEAHSTDEAAVAADSLKSAPPAPRMDIRPEPAFVLSSNSPIDENAVIVYVNDQPVKVSDVITAGSTALLLKPIPGMSESNRHRLVAAEIERELLPYVSQEIMLQHFKATLSPSEAMELSKAISTRDERLSRTLLPMLNDVQALKDQQNTVSLCLKDQIQVDQASNGALSRLSRSAQIAQQLRREPSLVFPGVERELEAPCSRLLLEARLRSKVLLDFEKEDFTDVMRSIAMNQHVSISVSTTEAYAKDRKVTYCCNDRPLGKVLQEILEPLGLQMRVHNFTVSISEKGSTYDAINVDHRNAHGIYFDSNDADLEPVLELALATRHSVQRRLLSTDAHTPWQIMTAVEGLRRDLLLKDGDKRVNALEWIQAGQVYQGEPWFEKTEYGGRAHPYSKPYRFEGHTNQFFSKLAACRLPLEATFGTPDGPITIQDMIKHAKMTTNDNEQVSWTLLALCRYLPPDAKWTNAKGEAWSIERLVEIEVGKTVGGPESPDGGTAGLYALATARNEYLKTRKPLEGVWVKADEKIRKYIDLAKSQQNPDGTLSSDFFRSGQRKENFDQRLSSTGHLLQFLMHAVSDEQLKEDWIRRAVEATANDMQLHRKEYVSCDPLYTATEALTTYIERVMDSPIETVSRTVRLASAQLTTVEARIDESATLQETEREMLLKATKASNQKPAPGGILEEPHSDPAKASKSPVPELVKDEASIEQNSPQYVVTKYFVADILASNKVGEKQPDFAPLIELIKTTIEPPTWRHKARIEADKELVGLVIRQTPEIQKQIQTLLKELRDSSHFVGISCKVMKIATTEQLEGLKSRCSLHASNDHKQWALLTKETLEPIVKFLTEDNTSLHSMEIAMSPGISATVKIEVPEGEDKGAPIDFQQQTELFRGCGLSVEPEFIGGSSVMRLKHSVYLNLKPVSDDPPGPITGAEGTPPLSVDESLVKAGQTLLVLIDTTNVKTELASDLQQGPRGKYVVMLSMEKMNEEEQQRP